MHPLVVYGRYYLQKSIDQNLNIENVTKRELGKEIKHPDYLKLNRINIRDSKRRDRNLTGRIQLTA